MQAFTNLFIAGYGKSSIAAIDFYLQNYPQVSIKVSELKSQDSFDQEQIKIYKTRGVSFEFSKQSPEFFDSEQKTFIMISPGIPPRAPIIQAIFKLAQKPHIEYGTDFDLFTREVASNYIAITGTNGKTTTTSLIAYALELEPIGNIGKPFLAFNKNDAIHICELSSFQLFYSQLRFKPKIAIHLNLTEDHLDWHQDFDEYKDSKAKLFTDDSLCVLNYDDPVTKELGQGLANKKFFSTKIKADAFLEGKQIFDSDDLLCRVEDLILVGEHNFSNILAASLALRAYGLENFQLISALKSFKPVSHRLEYLTEISGNKIYNDSKATNPDSAIRSLEAFDKSIVICGGKNKNLDLDAFISSLKQRAFAVIAIGELQDLILTTLEDFKNKEPAGSMEEAFTKAMTFTENNDYPIVLAPASSSFDMFDSYEQRGQVFKDIALKYKNAS